MSRALLAAADKANPVAMIMPSAAFQSKTADYDKSHGVPLLPFGYEETQESHCSLWTWLPCGCSLPRKTLIRNLHYCVVLPVWQL